MSQCFTSPNYWGYYLQQIFVLVMWNKSSKRDINPKPWICMAVSWQEWWCEMGFDDDWLVVWTPLKKYSSIGMIRNPIYGKIKNIKKCSKPPTRWCFIVLFHGISWEFTMNSSHSILHGECYPRHIDIRIAAGPPWRAISRTSGVVWTLFSGIQKKADEDIWSI